MHYGPETFVVRLADDSMAPRFRASDYVYEVLKSRPETGGSSACATRRRMSYRYRAQLPQARVQPIHQRLEGLRAHDRDPLPVRVRQDEVETQVCQRLAESRHRQLPHVGEVRLALHARLPNSGEEHLLRSYEAPNPRDDNSPDGGRRDGRSRIAELG